jgi:alpha-L-fucosidase 2
VKIQSEKGRPCTVQNPWPGRKVLLTRNGKAAESTGADRFTFPTTSGEIIVLKPNN